MNKTAALLFKNHQRAGDVNRNEGHGTIVYTEATVVKILEHYGIEAPEWNYNPTRDTELINQQPSFVHGNLTKRARQRARKKKRLAGKPISEMERLLGRSEGFHQMSPEAQWEEDKTLGILDWDGSDQQAHEILNRRKQT